MRLFHLLWLFILLLNSKSSLQQNANAATTCELMLPPLKGTRYESVSKNVFLPGETLTVICGEKYWLSNNQPSAVTTCNEKGDWTIRPVCTEVVCSNQRPQHVYSWEYNWWQKIKMGETTRYWCKKGYMSTDGATQATCTRYGWTPNPLCRESLGCGSPPPLTDGDIKDTLKSIYSHQESVEFLCQSYYTMEGGPNRTCVDGEWIGQMRCLKPCTVDRELMNRHNIAFRNINSDKLYLVHNDFMEFTCTKGRNTGTLPMRQQCIDGEVNLPTCQ